MPNFYLYYGLDKNNRKRFSILNGYSSDNIQFNNIIDKEEIQIQMPTDTIKIDLFRNPNSESDFENRTDDADKNKIKQLFYNLGINLNGGLFYLRRYSNDSNDYTLYNHNKKALFHMKKIE
jgi:hypothetical protein